jgi:hypothetical protein
MSRINAGWIVVLSLIATLGVQSSYSAETVSLAGPWRFHRDDKNAGIQEKWYQAPLPDPAEGPSQVHLPGSTDEARAGLLNPEKPSLEGLYRPNVYAGAAWYERDIDIPAGWQGKCVTLLLERVHWLTQAWFDGKEVGGPEDSLISPHRYDLGCGLVPGKHRLTLRVDNTLKIDLGASSIFFPGTQTNWNGVVGRLELEAVDPVSVADVQVYPDVDHKRAKARITITNATRQPVNGLLTLSVTDRQSGQQLPPVSTTIRIAGEQATADLVVKMGPDVKLWDEFSPSLYELRASFSTRGGASFHDERSVIFGMRKFVTRGTQFTMNGRPVFLRGTLECAIFPLTGYPSCELSDWQRNFRIMKSYGLNFVRFHSWCPPEAAFAAADIEGMMLQPEAPLANIGARRDPQREPFIEEELKRMVRTYGNHPSFCMMTLGNEYDENDTLLSHWIAMLKKEDPRHLYSSPSSGEMTANADYIERGAAAVRGPGTDLEAGALIVDKNRPWTGHELGQLGFYPNLDEIKKYTGVLKAENFELVRDDLRAKGMLDLAPQMFRACGSLSTLMYKEVIEQLLRTAGYPGFSLLDLHDYPGQGTAIVGVLDPFWDSKGFVTPEVHRQYFGPTVPLLLMPKRTYTSDEPFEASVEVAHYGPADLSSAQPEWTISDQQGRVVASGSLPAIRVPTGQLTRLGAMRASLAPAAAPARLTVSVSLHGTPFVNRWEIWVYPTGAPAAVPSGIVVSKEWDDATRQALASGRKVLLLPAGKLENEQDGTFHPIFWSPVMFYLQKPNTMSILCDPAHPLFAQFPTESYSNWQWWDLIQGSRTLNLNDTPQSFRPTVQVIDNFARNNKLASVFEARVGPGKLLVCLLNLKGDPKKQAAPEQFRRSLYSYLASDQFQPAQELTLPVLDKVFAPPSSLLVRYGAKVLQADSEDREHGNLAANAIDGDPVSFWHTHYEGKVDPAPHFLIIDIGREATLAGITYLPRQDMGNGRVSAMEVYASENPKLWGAPAGTVKWKPGKDLQTLRFAQSVKARYLKFVIPKPQTLAAVAELDILPADQQASGK